MAIEPNAIEQAVSRTLRDNLVRIQRTSEELNQAMSDLVSACASSRPTNALPPMVRAQASAAALSAALEVLSRFVTAALQPALRSPAEQEVLRLTSLIAMEPGAGVEQLEPAPAHPIVEESLTDASAAVHVQVSPDVARHEPLPAEPVIEDPAPFQSPAMPEVSIPADLAPAPESEPEPDRQPEREAESRPGIVEQAPMEIAPPEAEPVFAVDALPPNEQELHRRAYRVAKVSMQDIKMLRPEDVRIGRENKDLCFRLRDDIEKAHKEYDRRFQSIGTHPVDYFYDWMVEILAGGNAEALGEYPYPSPVLRR